MRPLAAVERFFERLFERPSARLFRARVQPLQIQRRIERAMETDRLSGADRTLVPNRFRVHLHPEDLEDFATISSSLATELAEGALSFARSHRYAVADRPTVDLVSDPGVGRGEIRVAASFADPVAVSRALHDDGEGGSSGPAAAAEAAPGGPDRTMVFQVPVVELPLARIRELRPNGTERDLELTAPLMSIGRGSDNDLVIHDSRVSRHHAQLRARRGTLVFTDLRSTNGSRVNGARVDEVVLGEGDRIELGDTVLVVESVPAE
jgi:hypothetical protein